MFVCVLKLTNGTQKCVAGWLQLTWFENLWSSQTCVKNKTNTDELSDTTKCEIMNDNNDQHLYSAFCQRIQSAAAYYYSIRKIVTVISLHVRVQLAKCTPYQHLDCNISHDWYLPVALRSMKQSTLSVLPKDSNTLAQAGLELTV